MSETKKGLFELLYAASKQVLDEIKKPQIRNKIKRKLHSAYDDAEAKIGEASSKIQKCREDFENYNVNTILEQKAIITQLRKLQEEIKEEYSELFAKEMQIEID